jgi:hypothetical protein
VVVQVDDTEFTGNFEGRRSQRYQGRTVSWVYGQGTRWHTMTARFKLKLNGEVGRRASLTLVGLDGENPGKNMMSVTLNGVTIFQGPNPLPNDASPGGDGPGNWGSAAFRVPGSLLQRNNTLSISNLEPSDCTRCPVFVMVDYVELAYRIRP